MISINKMQTMLDKIAGEVPDAFYRDLNGGISLLLGTIAESAAEDEDLFTLGEYCEDELGRYILIYYGSFKEVFADADEKEIEEELRETLFHEFTHHLESLAGEYGLEVKDAEAFAAYLDKRGKKETV